jgi:hypothetical protein
MVVEESAVWTAFAFSSALAADARLTTPTAAKPNVHLLNFIVPPNICLSMFSCLTLHLMRIKPVYPRTKTGAFEGEPRKST